MALGPLRVWVMVSYRRCGEQKNVNLVLRGVGRRSSAAISGC